MSNSHRAWVFFGGGLSIITFAFVTGSIANSRGGGTLPWNIVELVFLFVGLCLAVYAPWITLRPIGKKLALSMGALAIVAALLLILGTFHMVILGTPVQP